MINKSLLMLAKGITTAGKAEFEDLLNHIEEYSYTSEYLGVNTIVDMEHVCGHKWKMSPNVWMTHAKTYYVACPACKLINKKTVKKRIYKFYAKYTIKDCDEIIEKVGNGEWKRVSSFVNMYTDTNIEHSCGKIYTETPSNWLKIRRSSAKCKCQILTKEEQWLRTIKTNGKGAYIPLEMYDTYTTPVDLYHTVCGDIFTITPSRFSEGKRCLCKDKVVDKEASFKNELEAIYGVNMIDLVKPLKDICLPMRFKCIEGHEWDMPYAGLIFCKEKGGCPTCKEIGGRVVARISSRSVKIENKWRRIDASRQNQLIATLESIGRGYTHI